MRALTGGYLIGILERHFVLFSVFFMAKYTVSLKEIREVADDTRLFVFNKPEGYVFQAGQYAAMVLPKLVEPDSKGAVRSLSIASAPEEADLSFAMRSGVSSFKKTCWQMQPGDTVDITSAVGFFTVPKDETQSIVFLVGGIGITPVRAILKQAEHEGSERQYTLFYANRFTKDAAFDEEIRHLKLKHFRYVTILSRSQESCAPENDERGYMNGSMLKKYVQDVPHRLYYLVGSPQFITAMEEILADLGVPRENCKKDPFTGMTAQSVK